MSTTAIRLPIANIEGWLVNAVTNPLRDAGGQPVPRSALERMATSRVGPTAMADGLAVAKANGALLDDGAHMIITECLRLLREQDWTTGPDNALVWTGPSTRLEIQVSDRMITLPSAADRQAADRLALATLTVRGDGRPLTVIVGTRERSLTVHPLALALPVMTGEEIERLYDDIAANGVREPLWLYEGKVLDGRHRLAMAYAAQKPVSVRNFEGTARDATRLVISENLARRHLTSAQTAVALQKLFAEDAKAQAREAAEASAKTAIETRWSKGDTRVQNHTRVSPHETATAAPAERSIYERFPASSPQPGAKRKRNSNAGRWETIASKAAGGIISPGSLKKLDDARLDEAPETRAKVESGEIRSVAAAARAAAAERGVQPPGPIPSGVAKHLAHARYSLNQAIAELSADGGGTDPIKVRSYLSDITERVAKIRGMIDRSERPASGSDQAVPSGRGSGSAAYLIEVDDTKQGVCYPTVVGPFTDSAAAAAFADEMQMGTAAQGGQGGYSAAHVISDPCDYTPERYREEYSWRITDD